MWGSDLAKSHIYAHTEKKKADFYFLSFSLQQKKVKSWRFKTKLFPKHFPQKKAKLCFRLFFFFPSGIARAWRERRLTSPEAKRDLQQSGLVCALSPPLQLGSTCSLLLPNLLLFFPCSSLIKPSVRSPSPPTWTSSTPSFHIFFILLQTQEI